MVLSCAIFDGAQLRSFKQQENPEEYSNGFDDGLNIKQKMVGCWECTQRPRGHWRNRVHLHMVGKNEGSLRAGASRDAPSCSACSLVY